MVNLTMVPPHHRILLYNRKEKTTDTTTAMDLQGIMLSKKPN